MTWAEPCNLPGFLSKIVFFLILRQAGGGGGGDEVVIRLRLEPEKVGGCQNGPGQLYRYGSPYWRGFTNTNGALCVRLRETENTHRNDSFRGEPGCG